MTAGCRWRQYRAGRLGGIHDSGHTGIQGNRSRVVTGNTGDTIDLVTWEETQVGGVIRRRRRLRRENETKQTARMHATPERHEDALEQHKDILQHTQHTMTHDSTYRHTPHHSTQTQQDSTPRRIKTHEIPQGWLNEIPLTESPGTLLRTS